MGETQPAETLILDFQPPGLGGKKCLQVTQETRVQSLGQEALLEKEMTTHFSILSWRIPWMEELGGYSPWDRKELNRTEHARMHSFKPLSLWYFAVAA